MSGDKPRALALAYLVGEGRARLDDLLDIEHDPWLEHVPVKLHSPDELVDRISAHDAQALIIEADDVPAEVIDATGSLAVIGDARGDPVNVDVEAATAAGVLVLRTPGRNAGAVADLTIAFLLSLTRGIVVADRQIRAGEWAPGGRIAQQRLRGRALEGATLGLLGFGAVAHAVVARAAAFGLNVIASDPFATDHPDVEMVDLDELLARSDFLSIHAALTDETRGMIGKDELAKLPDGAFLVNTARGPIVDVDALVVALESGRLAGAALDHFEGEYLPPDSPLCLMENVILTPHIGGASADADARQTSELADAFAALASGTRPDASMVVNPDVLDTARARLW